MNNKLKLRLQEFVYGSLAIAVGAVIVYLGGWFLNVSMDVFYGIGTFSTTWALNLFLVTFISGIVVSLIYGLGGKMLAHFAPMPVYFYSYFTLDKAMLPDGVAILPFGYWLLVVILAVEFAGLGGFLGEVLIKKTYGRRPKHLIHKRYQVKMADRLKSAEGQES